MGLRIGIPLFLVAFTVDFATKSAAVRWDGHVIFHDVPAELPKRVVMSLLAIGAAAAFTRVSERRKLGRPWGAWLGVPLLVAGILGNGVSSYLWPRGVPDFIPSGDWVFNVADFEIFFGIVGGILTLIAGFCLSYALERRNAHA
ncbi:MAG TPA: signal peptidase II [Gaiellaceae bacterium]